jgi:hypothetical protein
MIFFSYIENDHNLWKKFCFEGWVYVMPPFDLDSDNYLRPNHPLFSIHSETINDTLELLRHRNLL